MNTFRGNETVMGKIQDGCITFLKPNNEKRDTDLVRSVAGFDSSWLGTTFCLETPVIE